MGGFIALVLGFFGFLAIMVICITISDYVEKKYGKSK